MQRNNCTSLGNGWCGSASICEEDLWVRVDIKLSLHEENHEVVLCISFSSSPYARPYLSLRAKVLAAWEVMAPLYPSYSVTQLCHNSFVTPQTKAYQIPLSMDFLGKNTRVGCHFLLQGTSWPKNQTRVSCLAERFFITEPPGMPTPPPPAVSSALIKLPLKHWSRGQTWRII